MKMVIFGDEPKSWPEEILSNFQFSEHTLRLWAYQNSNQPKPFEYITNKVESMCAQKLASRSIVCSRYKMNTTIQLQFLCVQSCSFICLDFSIYKTILLSPFNSVRPYLSVSLFSVAFAPHCSVLLGKIMYPAVEDRTWIDVAICKTISSKVDDFYGIFFH